jgi:hypothetical protein
VSNTTSGRTLRGSHLTFFAIRFAKSLATGMYEGTFFSVFQLES